MLMQIAGTEEAYLVEDRFANILLFKIDLGAPGIRSHFKIPLFFLITLLSILACKAVSVRWDILG